MAYIFRREKIHLIILIIRKHVTEVNYKLQWCISPVFRRNTNKLFIVED